MTEVESIVVDGVEWRLCLGPGHAMRPDGAPHTGGIWWFWPKPPYRFANGVDVHWTLTRGEALETMAAMIADRFVHDPSAEDERSKMLRFLASQGDRVSYLTSLKDLEDLDSLG